MSAFLWSSLESLQKASQILFLSRPLLFHESLHWLREPHTFFSQQTLGLLAIPQAATSDVARHNFSHLNVSGINQAALCAPQRLKAKFFEYLFSSPPHVIEVETFCLSSLLVGRCTMHRTLTISLKREAGEGIILTEYILVYLCANSVEVVWHFFGKWINMA